MVRKTSGWFHLVPGPAPYSHSPLRLHHKLILRPPGKTALPSAVSATVARIVLLSPSQARDLPSTSELTSFAYSIRKSTFFSPGQDNEQGTSSSRRGASQRRLSC